MEDLIESIKTLIELERPSFKSDIVETWARALAEIYGNPELLTSEPDRKEAVKDWIEGIDKRLHHSARHIARMVERKHGPKKPKKKQSTRTHPARGGRAVRERF